MQTQKPKRVKHDAAGNETGTQKEQQGNNNKVTQEKEEVTKVYTPILLGKEKEFFSFIGCYTVDGIPLVCTME